MSGFVALFNLDRGPLDPAADGVWLQDATAAMHFRGPDAQARWQEGPVGLGHTLLRTTDEAAQEQQPCTLDNQVWLVADARIDDRARLLASLRGHGRTLQDDAPDPLLILHAYAVWGDACVEHLLGDFAFVLWDAPAQRLICCRDQVGAVPVFYAQVSKRLVISNTLNIVRSLPGVADTLDDKAAVDFLLTNYYGEDDATIFAAIRRLPPAHQLVATEQGLRITRYWEPPAQVEYLRYRDPQEYVDHFRQLLTEAVRDRLRTDRIGSDLSGGLDSTTVTVVAHQLLHAQGKTPTVRGATIAYSWLMDGMDDEEGALAQEVADFAGFATHKYMAEEYLARVPEVAPAHPDPEPWTVNALWSHRDMMRDTAQDARVYFLGFGGDPLLSWARVPWANAFALGQFRSVARDVRQKWRGVARTFSKPSANPWEEARRLNRALVAPDLAARAGLDVRRQDLFGNQFMGDQRRGMFTAPLWETIFRMGDPGYTGIPVKTRLPFFDLRLIDFMMRVPPDPWCLNKYILRQATTGLLPESVRLRRKTPLGRFPFFVWVEKHGIPAWVHELAAQPALDAYIDRTKLNELLTTPSMLTVANWRMVYGVLSFAHWLRQGNFM